MRPLLCALALLACEPGSDPPPLRPAIDARPPLDAAGRDASPADAALDATAPDQTTPDHTAPADGAAVDAAVDAMVDAMVDAAVDQAPDPPDAAPPIDHCVEARGFGPQFGEIVDRWTAQDALDPPPPGAVVFVGSSSIRRWEALQADFSDYAPLQRGMGGAQLGEIARSADALVTAHAPRAAVVYAGTNDLAVGVPPEIVVERLRCLRQQLARHDPPIPLFFIGITPTPARWDQWPAAAAVNRAVEALAAADPGLRYVDTPAPFLATGGPPAAHLFVADGLHLSAAGYALWQAEVRGALEAWGPAAPVADHGPPPGTRLLIDLGPSNPEDGERTPAPDHLGQHWNNWHPNLGDDVVVPGEHLGPLVSATGAATGARLIVAGGFKVNGRQNGGLLWPDPALLGPLAVGSATGDFFYIEDDDHPGALTLAGLAPDRPHRVRLFASRASPERRVTRYTLRGASAHIVELQTSGAGAGEGDGNDQALATAELRPDPWGRIFIDVALAEGGFAYLSLIEVEVR